MQATENLKGKTNLSQSKFSGQNKPDDQTQTSKNAMMIDTNGEYELQQNDSDVSESQDN